MPGVDPFEADVAVALDKRLRAVGITAEVHTERVRGTKLFRFFVVAKKFKRMDYSERQNVVWRIVQEALAPAKVRRISMIMTLTPEEFGVG